MTKAQMSTELSRNGSSNICTNELSKHKQKFPSSFLDKCVTISTIAEGSAFLTVEVCI